MVLKNAPKTFFITFHSVSFCIDYFSSGKATEEK